MANEPLAEQEIITFLRLREEIPDGEAGDKLVAKGLAAIASMLRRAPDPEGEDGFMLHHLSLREHILTTETMSHHVEKSRKAFAKAAMSPDDEASISNYLYRTGIDHLLSNNQVDDAREKLLDIDYLGKMFNLGKQNLDILQYWLKIGDDDQGQGYIESVNKYMERDLKEDQFNVLIYACLSFFVYSSWDTIGLEIGRKILKAGEIKFKPDDKILVIIKSILGLLLSKKGEYIEAEALYRKVIEINKRVLGAEHKNTLLSMSDLGLLLSNKGEYIEAEKIHRLTLEAQTKVFGLEHVDTIITTTFLATTLYRKGEYKEAEILFRKSLEVEQRDLGLEHSNTISSMNNLALSLSSLGEYKEAEILFRRVMEIQRRVLGPKHQKMLITEQNFAIFLRDNTNYPKKAIPLLERILDIRRKENIPQYLASILTALGTTYGKCNLFDEAVNTLEESINIRRKLLKNGYLSKEPLIASLNRLQEVYEKNGKEKEIKRTQAEIKSYSVSL